LLFIFSSRTCHEYSARAEDEEQTTTSTLSQSNAEHVVPDPAVPTTATATLT
jgi:hypothetical protein